MKLERGCGSGVLEELKGRIGDRYDQNTLYTYMKLSKNKLTLKNHGLSITLIHLEMIINYSSGHNIILSSQNTTSYTFTMVKSSFCLTINAINIDFFVWKNVPNFLGQ